MVYAYLLEGVYILSAWWVHAQCMVYTYLACDFCILTFLMVCVYLVHSLCVPKHFKFVTKECIFVDIYLHRLVTHGLRTQQNNLWDFYLLMQVLMYGLVMSVVQGGVMATCQCPSIQRFCSLLCAFFYAHPSYFIIECIPSIEQSSSFLSILPFKCFSWLIS